MTSHKLATLQAIQARAVKLRSLLDVDPGKAIKQARTMKATSAHEHSANLLRAGIFIDAGGITQQIDVVKEGVELLRQLRETDPAHPSLQYNLANGLGMLADLDKTPPPDWYFATRALRQEARELWDVVRALDERSLRTQALTNLGNALSKSHRWSEAYDAYVAALEEDPSNGVAAGQAALMLLRGVSAGMGDQDKMEQVAAHYAAIAKTNRTRVVDLAGKEASELFGQLPDGKESLDLGNSPPIKNAYLRFVAQHHLALVPTIEGLNASLRRWDSLQICCFYESIDASHETPPLFAMLNTIKAGYLAARQIAFQAEQPRRIRETGLYIDTLDYASYGTTPAMLLLAQRSAMDVLDQIAAALNDYLKVGLKPNHVYFSNFWRKDKSKPRWRAALEQEIADGNKAVIALGELAEDLGHGGYLHRKRKARNASTHRFTVLHDMMGSFRTNPAIEHVDLETFRAETIETLQAVRAAILYFVEVIVLREYRLKPSGKTAPLLLPAHHWVRGRR